MPIVESTSRKRMSMYNSNRLKVGLFGANCSSGRAVTMVPERWSGSWKDSLRLAHMAEEAGMGGYPIIGDPDHVAKVLTDLSNAGLNGIGLSFINYLDELPFFRDEVLARLSHTGIRQNN